jgi:hypothetical protein
MRCQGMLINAGARVLLLQSERQKFLAAEWPRISSAIQRLGLTPEELLDGSAKRRSKSKTQDSRSSC